MDFDDHDDGDEEMAPMPVSSSYETPPPQQPSVFGGGGGLAPPNKPPGEPVVLPRASKAPGGGGGGGRYRECLKNHAVGIGGHAVDGCGEFMAAGEEGTLDALRCAACNCHRNFHRKESPTAAAGEGSPISAGALVAYGATPHHQFSPYYDTTAPRPGTSTTPTSRRSTWRPRRRRGCTRQGRWRCRPPPTAGATTATTCPPGLASGPCRSWAR
ncbi:unnamed protein product [Urochloa humidicola]